MGLFDETSSAVINPDTAASDNAFLDKVEAGFAKEIGQETTSPTTEDAERASVIDEPKPDATPKTDEATAKDSSSSTPDANKKPDETKKPEENPDLDANGKPKSRYAKEIERRDRSWKALNEEKEKFAAEQAALKAEREAWQKEQEARQAEAPPEYTPEQYDKAAADAEAEGDWKGAELAKATAKAMRDAAKEIQNHPQFKKIEAQRKEAFQKAYNDSAARAWQKFPNVAKPGTPENKAALEIYNGPLKEHWDQFPGAPEVLGELVASRLQAARVPELEKSIAELRSQIKTLETAIAPEDKGSPAEIPGEKPESEMSEQELDAKIRRELMISR